MTTTTILAVWLMTQASAGQPTSTQPEAPTAAPQPAATAPSEKSAELESLLDTFSRLYQSLQAKGGIAPEDYEVVRSLRDRAAAFNERWPDDEGGLAIEIQLAMWLEDHDRVDRIFARFVGLKPDDVRVGFAWANYFQRINDRHRVEEIFTRLGELYPGNAQVRLAWADHLKGFNEYARAIETLTGDESDLSEFPLAAMTLSDCLFAEHRFQEAVDVLQSIPEQVLAENRFLSQQIEQVLPSREQYVELWAKEQEIRSAEEAADDLPRAELITARGRIVVELFENEAPNTVANFISLAEAGFYDDTKFHRVIANFMTQGGDPNTKPGATGNPGQGSPGYRIPDEHDREGFRNHFTGSLAMAKTAAPHTAGCQFYITHTPPAHLNGKHTVFGRVIEGLEVARNIEPNDVLESVSVLRKRGHEYSPQTLPEIPSPPPAANGTPTTPLRTTGSQDPK